MICSRHIHPFSTSFDNLVVKVTFAMDTSFSLLSLAAELIIF